MKKNRMMRLASVLLICVLLTTSIVGGTFAKYVTTNTGADSARVAKFGVVITLEDDMGLFDTEYATDDADYTGSVSVEAETDRLVAPGTSGWLSFSINGTPEVATKVTVEFDGTPIVLEAGTYELPAGEFADVAVTADVTATAGYEPVRFYLGSDPIDENTEYAYSLSTLESALEAMSVYFDPNETLDSTLYIGWQWAFEGEFDGAIFTTDLNDDYSVVDFLDTYLGNEETPQTESLNLKITVEQVD